jgi:holo-[acyl-carrier protein] synthase
VILGVGVDLVDVPRMEKSLKARWGDRFVERVFSDEEIEACERTSKPAQGYAARFAAKEALVKALGTGFSRGIQPAQIHVHGTERQRPILILDGRALEAAESMRVAHVHLALTHTDRTACAVVVLEGAGL